MEIISKSLVYCEYRGVAEQCHLVTSLKFGTISSAALMQTRIDWILIKIQGQITNWNIALTKVALFGDPH